VHSRFLPPTPKTQNQPHHARSTQKARLSALRSNSRIESEDESIRSRGTHSRERDALGSLRRFFPREISIRHEQCFPDTNHQRAGLLGPPNCHIFALTRTGDRTNSARAHDQRVPLDCPSRTDNAGQCWRSEPTEPGRKRPRTGRTAHECFTCDDRLMAQTIDTSRDAFRSIPPLDDSCARFSLRDRTSRALSVLLRAKLANLACSLWQNITSTR